MKIVILVSHFPPKWIAGTEVATYNIAKHIAKRGHKVHVVTRYHPSLPRFEKKDGFCVHRVWYLDFSVIRMITHLIMAFMEIGKIRPDVIQGQMISPNGLLAIISGLFFGSPSVTWIRGSDIYMTSRLFKKTVGKFVVKRSTILITLTENMKNQTRQLVKRKDIVILPNGVELGKFANLNKESCRKKLSIPQNEIIILFVGRLIKLKGVKYLLDAFSTVVEAIPCSKLWLIGDGEQRRYLEERSKNLRLKNNIRFIGEIPNFEVPEYMRAVDIFVLPSLSEGFPTVILEAMASGLPVIASNVGGLPEIIKDSENGFLVEPKDSDELSNKIVFLLKDKNLRKKISRNNLKEVKKYTWENIIEELEKKFINLSFQKR